MHPQPSTGPDIKNLMLALLAATAIMMAWQHFYERPRQEAARVQQAAQQVAQQAKQKAEAVLKVSEAATEEAAVADAPRIRISTPALHGSINVVGSRFDELTLANYRETQAADAPEVKLLAPANKKEAYFVELGMLGQQDGLKLPNASTQWQTKDSELTVEKPITLTWNNGAGLSFIRTISVDEHYMFTIRTKVKNEGASAVTLYPYGLISRNPPTDEKSDMLTHVGPLGVINEVLEDTSYKKVRDTGSKKFENAKGWVGITDKYWLTALVPAANETFTAEYKHFTRDGMDAYQADVRGSAVELPVGGEEETTTHLFAGAKEVNQLDHYRDTLNIPLFDRAVDFGSLYFLTRPIFALLSYFYSIVGNFGVAILLLTVVIKALLYPLANKSMVAMSKMRILTPKMNEIRERFSDDKMKMNQEIMAMYKREKVNPMSGCLPVLLQIPVFFALYRVLSVSLEMRHAPFFGWVKDLSAPDTANLFTAFGFIPWDVPSFLHLGVWPMILCVTMIIQQRLNPKPADPVQAAMMNYMPFIFLLMFMGFPAGLVIYYSWNNLLSILQQYIINKQLDKKGLRHK
jgi:YidC/Oxa1 family membrane protein insertase